MGVGGQADRQLFDDFEAVAFEPDDWRVVGQESDLPDAEVLKHLAVRSRAGHGKTELLVGFDGVQTLFLQFVGVDLGTQTDTDLLSQVEQHATLEIRRGRRRVTTAIAL